MGIQDYTFPLAVYGFQNVFIDKILILKLRTSNSDPQLIGRWYLNVVSESGGRYWLLHAYQLIQSEMNEFRSFWNSHRVRKKRKLMVPKGIPDHLYEFTELHGAKHCGLEVLENDAAEIESLSGVGTYNDFLPENILFPAIHPLHSITAISDNPNDQAPVTPKSKSSLQRKGPSIPPGIFSTSDSSSRKRWKQAQFLAESFLKRRINEYFPLLQSRQNG